MPVLSNPKHEAVVHAYIRDPSRIGWKAYKSAFPKAKQHAAQTAWSRLLRKAGFSARIAELLEAAADDAVMCLNEILVEFSKVGRADMRDFVHLALSDNLVEAVNGLAPEQSAAIQELTVESYTEPDERATTDEVLEGQANGGGLKRRKREDKVRVVKRVKLKLHPKLQALSELRDHFTPKRVEHTGKDGKPIQTEAVGELTDLELARRIAFALEQGARAAPGAPAPAAEPAKPPAKPAAKRKRKRS